MSKQTEYIEKEVAKRLGIPHEQVRIVMIDFFHALLMALQHPDRHFYKGIIIDSCFKIKVNPAVIMRAYMSKLKNNKFFKTKLDLNLLHYFKILNFYGVYTQKQKEAINDINERCNYDPYQDGVA